jgi:signal transduction histidine kinase
MAAQLAKAVKAPFALVGELLPGKPERVRTLGFHARGATQENFDYELAGTPCERVVGKNLCCHVRGIRAEFPADDMLRDMACEGYVGTPLIAPDGRVLGLIAVLYQQPIQKPETVKTLVRIFAARAAAELAQLRAEETSHQTTALQSAVLDALPAAVVVLDGAGRIQRVNRGWESVATARDPAPASDWTGRPYSQVCSRVLHLDTRDANRLIAGILGVRTGQRKEWQAECATVAGRSWKLLAAPLPRPEGLGVVVMHIDVTEQRKLEEQLRQSQKMEAIGQLAGGIAHDFNNLLTVIYGHLSLLQDSQGLSPEDRTLLQDAEFAAERASALTRQLLTFSRHQQMRLVPVDLSDTVRSTSRLLARVLGEEITLDLDLAPRLGAVEADAGMIGQVLLNFAVNARDAMTGTGRLTIRTCEQTLAEARLEGGQRILPGHYIVLSVQDIGSGIAPENLSRIFEPFFTTKESGRGTGIGLATVYSIVQQHRGVVTVQSKLGGGSTFTVYLPATPGQVGQARERTSRPELPRGSETVLLVEDDPHVRHTVSYALERRGYRIIEAVSGPDALEVWARERDQIALVLTDMVLPGGLSGLELGQRFQAEKADMKVIYMSGYNPSQSAADVELTPGVNFLQKPFLLTELIQLIRARLNA